MAKHLEELKEWEVAKWKNQKKENVPFQEPMVGAYQAKLLKIGY